MPTAISPVYVDRIHTRLLQTIICAFSEEMRDDTAADGAYEVPAAVDLLAVLCEHYLISPGVTAQTVRRWHAEYMELLAPLLEASKEDYQIQRPQILEETFERLAALAEKHPPFGWKEDD